ncbi:amidohydrolase family protein [bacterium]|nr:amidohydrolase family protein [bacterium]
MHPGFVDLQVNGFMGVDFSTPGLTVDAVRRATLALVKRGTIAYCPTIITSPQQVYEENIAVIVRAMGEPDLAPHLLGLHLEGPFISPADGARGAHKPQFMVKPGVEAFKRLQDLAKGNIRIITVAPEVDGAVPLITHASAHGTVVAIGHSAAGEKALQAAVDAGARLSTHLGNAAPPTHTPRHSMIFWQLACDKLSCSFITDGHHLPDVYTITALRAKGIERFIVVSDSAPVAGMPPGEYECFHIKVVIEPSGRLHSPETGTLAGSSATMLQCINHLASLNLVDEAGLWRVGYSNPLALIGVEEKRFEGMKPLVKLVAGRFTV